MTSSGVYSRPSRSRRSSSSSDTSGPSISYRARGSATKRPIRLPDSSRISAVAPAASSLFLKPVSTTIVLIDIPPVNLIADPLYQRLSSDGRLNKGRPHGFDECVHLFVEDRAHV